jgi:hypothetical protein
MQAQLFGGRPPAAAAAAAPASGAVYNQTDDRPASWMAVDLGEGVTLYPERYCLRTDSDGTLAPSPWQLQGSSDGVVWVVLRRHVDEKWKGASGFMAFAAPPNPTPAGNAAPALAEASWKLEPALVQGRGFRHFRIVQTGPNLGGTNVLACAGIELYGVLETAPKPLDAAPKAAAALRTRLRTAAHAGPQAFTELLQHLRSRVRVLSSDPTSGLCYVRHPTDCLGLLCDARALLPLRMHEAACRLTRVARARLRQRQCKQRIACLALQAACRLFFALRRARLRRAQLNAQVSLVDCLLMTSR